MATKECNIETIKYTEFYIADSPHDLQTIDIFQLPKARSALWVVFLHGGAWRDPEVTSAAGNMVLSGLLNSLPTLVSNAASINYRLSPHPSYPELSQNVAKHPDHLHDVLAGLKHLCKKYEMHDYVVIGHSAGATLAFQVLEAIQKAPKGELPLPRALYGLEGIYDLAALTQEYPHYRGFVEGAFGDEKEWPKPLALGGYTGLVVLAQSDDDGLLSWRQTQEMKERCDLTLGVGGGLRVVKVEGQHDDVLASKKLAGVVERYLREF